MGLETICAVGEYLCWIHPLKLPYLDTWRSRLISWLKVKAMTGNWLVCRSRLYAIYGKPCVFEGQGWSSDHPGSIHCLILIWTFPEATSTLWWQSYSESIYFKINWKRNEKKCWESRRNIVSSGHRYGNFTYCYCYCWLLPIYALSLC